MFQVYARQLSKDYSNLRHLITYVLQCSLTINEYVNLTFIISLTYLPMKTYTIIDRVKYWYTCAKCACVASACTNHTRTIRKHHISYIYIYNNNNNNKDNKIIMIHIDRTFMDTRHNNHKYLTELTYKHVIFSSSSIINY